ncbi:uncharacterized protein LOC106011753 [Aplysia californica]|uniref:Uncharacterized protein LOC106011753 n=1 Tax=Aplysia californica TaxID=6500 RepID=A0ABM0ZZT7_APLCA|nr:uncharacterized protein LOC106011753 [Aplysia californica]
MNFVNSDRGERFAFKCPELSDFATVLREKSSSQECKHSTLCTRKGDSEYRAFVKPENRGNYKLSVYGKLKFSTDRSFHLLVDYFITADEVEDQFSPFPQHFGVWGPNSLAIDFGFSRRIYKFDVLACRSGELYVKLPIYKFTRTKSVLAPAVTDKGDDSNKTNGGMFNNLSTLTQYAEGVVHIKARFPEDGFYSLSLLAQNHEITDDATTTFINVANFVVNCMRSSPVASPYPKCFPITQNYQCLLLEPLFRDLHVGQTYTFRLRSPILSKVKIESQAMVKIQVSDDEEDGPGGSKSEKGRPTEEEWIAEFTAKCVGSSVCIYGCPESSASLCALYIFNVTSAESDVETMSTHM